MNKSSKVLFRIMDVLVIFTMIFASPMSVLAANPSANLDQCANDPAPSSHLDGCNSNANQWVNGNLGASKAVYQEGDSIPYRITFTNLSTSGTHVVTIEWDTTKQSKHALDYIDTYTQTVGNANACLGITGCGSGSFAATTFAIPPDPQVTGAGVTPIAGNFTMYGGTITSVSPYFYSTGTGFTGDKSAGIMITFTASVANPVLAWGGHIATRQNWGAGNSAISISGSPYHTRLLDLDGSGGNQDRSLSAEAVIFPAHVTVIKHADVPSSTAFNFTATGLTPASFSLTDNSSSTDPQQTFGDITTFGAKSVSESSPLPGYKLDSITCVEDMTQNTTRSINSGGAGGTASIVLEEGENVTCTFTNSAQNAHLSITKVATESGYSHVGDVIHYTIVATNDGNTTLAAVTVTDPNAAGLTCTPANGSSLAPSASMNCTASHTITQADIDAGSYFNQACVDDGAGGAAQACADVTTPGTQTRTLSITKDDDTASYDHVGQLITFTIVATNTGNVPQAITVSDTPALDNFGCTPANGSTVAPGGTMSCTGTHTVTQADLNAGNFHDVACADATGATQACAPDDVPGTLTRTLSITKDDDTASYDHVGQVITFTIVATNTGNVPQDITVSDTPALDNFGCTPANGSTVAPSGTMSCTGTHTVTQADLDARNFHDVACANAAGATEVCAPDDVPGTQPVPSQITPTATTCDQFNSGTAATLSELQYAVKSGKVSSVAPGVFFYWVKVTAVAGSNSFTINQAITSSNNNFNHFFSQASGTAVYTSGCVKINNANISTSSSGVTTVTFNASSAGTYIIGIKYDSTSVKNFNAPSPNTTVHYTFTLEGFPLSTQGLDLTKKP